MATERIDIVVSERGSRVVKRNLENIGRGAQGAQSAVRLLNRALLTLGSVAAIRALVNLVDTFTTLQNRLRTVTTGTAQLTIATTKLFQVANRTRSSFRGTVEVFARTALAVKDLGISQQETVEFTESLNKAVILSGATAMEASNAMIQLSQGLASGALRGDELRSVLEQLPVVADVIAKSLGVTRGELRLLGAEGKISAEVVLKAFREAREELDERFGKSIPTIGQAFVVLGNNVLNFVGTLDTAQGASSALSTIIISLSENIDTLARSFAAAALVIGGAFARTAMNAAISAVKTLGAVIAANPLGALLLAIGSAIALLITFSDKITISSDSATTLADVFVVAFEEIKKGFNALIDIVEPTMILVIGAVESIVGPINLSFRGILIGAASVADGILGTYRGLFDTMIAIFTELPGALGDLFFQAMNGIVDIVNKAADQIAEILNTITEPFGTTITNIPLESLVNPFIGEAEMAGAAIGSAFKKGFEGTTFASDAIANILQGADQRSQRRGAQQQRSALEGSEAEAAFATAGTSAAKSGTKQTGTNALKDFLRDLERQTGLLKLNNDERKISVALFRAEDVAKRELTGAETLQIIAAVELNTELALQKDLLEEVNGVQDNYKKNIEALTTLLDEGKISLEQFNEKFREFRIELLDTKDDAFSGLERGLLKVNAQMKTTAELVEESLVGAFNSAEDALTDFIKTGKLDFKSLADSILSDLARLAAKQLISGLAGAVFGATGGQGGQGGSFFGGGGGGGGGGSAAGSLIQTGFSALAGLAGFAHGGGFQVGGVGGTDKNLLSINNRPVARVSKGEMVNVTPQGETDGGGGRPVVVNFNITTPDAGSFRNSQEQLLTRASVAMNRASRRNS